MNTDTLQHPTASTEQHHLSAEIRALIKQKNLASLTQSADPLSRLGGSLAVHCRADLKNRSITEAASMATIFRGYESLLPGKALDKVGLVSATASGLCGGVHATASALCLEMALGMKPPPLGIVLRNLLLSCQYLNDNSMHLFVLAGPDYSQDIIERSNPEVWHNAQHASCRFTSVHGYRKVSDIMVDLNKERGALYKEALSMVSVARKAYTLLGGQYPHSKSIIPGGISFSTDAQTIMQFQQQLLPFAKYSAKTAAIWDDVFDFMLAANPRYEEVGKSSASLLDFGQWDHPNFYDGQYAHCDAWGAKRWSTPAAIIDGKLACTRLSLLNAGMEERLDYSFQTRASLSPDDLISHDPLGNPITPLHPWNKRMTPKGQPNPQAYSWGSSLTWQGHGFEVGAYSRLYLTAVAQQIPASEFLQATGTSLDFVLDPNIQLQWQVPSIWNAFERNRARAYALAFSYAVTLENINIANNLLQSGETATFTTTNGNANTQNLGVGLWGASRGFLAHWAVLKNDIIDNYQISIPSRVNVGTCTASKAPGPLEKALLNTPIIETAYQSDEDFTAIDIQRAIQSFDPCMSCTSHVLIEGTDTVLDKVVDTSFPV